MAPPSPARAPDRVTATVFMRYTSMPRDSAATGSSPTERSRRPNGVRHRTHQVSGNSATPKTTSRDTPRVRPPSAPPTSDRRIQSRRSSHPNRSGLRQPSRSPPDRNGTSRCPMPPSTRGLWVAPAAVSLEHDDVEVAGHPGAEEVDGDAGHDVVDAEPHGGDGVEQPTERPADHAEDHAPPRTELHAAVGAEPGPEDEHALEADVDDPGPLRPQTAQAGQPDRERQAQGGAERARARETRAVGDGGDHGERREPERAEGEVPHRHARAEATRRLGAPGPVADHGATRSSSTCADTSCCCWARRTRRTIS